MLSNDLVQDKTRTYRYEYALPILNMLASFTVLMFSSSFRSTQTTSHPNAAYCNTSSRPIPCAEPVICKKNYSYDNMCANSTKLTAYQYYFATYVLRRVFYNNFNNRKKYFANNFQQNNYAIQKQRSSFPNKIIKLAD